MSVASSMQQLHPHLATPIRHNSLPFDQTQQQGPIAGPSYRQMSMSALGAVPNSSPPIMPQHVHGVVPEGAMTGSPSMLNPNSSVSASPSPLRTNLPHTASPEGMFPSPVMKMEDGQSQHSSQGMFTSPTGIVKMEDNIPQLSGQGSPYGSQPNSGATGGNGSTESQQNSKFVHKLFRMVSDAEYQHLISWNANGTSVVVTNFDEFSNQVLGKHFKHSNFSSFIRQLNMYGFYKVNKTPRGHRHAPDTQVWEFSHPKFIRNRPELLDEIRRKALDSEHARVEARDLQYSVSVGYLQLRQHVEEQQFRLDEMFEMNAALRHTVLGLRDTLSGVLDWIKANHGDQLPFENRMASVDLPPTPMMHSFASDHPVQWAENSHMNPHQTMPVSEHHGEMQGDGPSIFVTEPGLGPPPPNDVFSMSGLNSVSPMGSRRVSSGSQASERMDMSSRGLQQPRMSIDTAFPPNPGLGVMGLSGQMTGEMQMAINTPLPPSPNVAMPPNIGNMSAVPPYVESNFLSSPSVGSYPTHGYFSPSSNGIMQTGGSFPEDGAMAMGRPNAKAMRTKIKRTASNSGQKQAEVAAMALHQQPKRKSPGI